MRHRENLPKVYLFTTNIGDIDWFGWGDVLYLITSIAAVIQAVMIVSPISDDDNNIFYLYSKCYTASSPSPYILIPFLCTANVLFLVDSLLYFIGYMVFLLDLRYSLLTGEIRATHTTAIR
jgi:hypothetical protein